eukprot:15485716-Alexandrium_andersonii.AAC.1
MRGLRIITGNPPEGPASTLDKPDTCIMAMLGAQHVETRLWAARLTYLARMTAHGGPILNAVVQSTPLLRQQTVSDLPALHRLSEKLAWLPGPYIGPEP